MTVKENINTAKRSVEPVLAPHSLDENSINDFIERVEAQLAQGESRVIVDCSPLERVISSHINGLWLAHETCQGRQAQLQLINVSAGLRRILDALNLTPILLRNSSSPGGLDLRVSPTAKDIEVAMSELVSYLIRSGLPELTAFELQTIFYEIATNIRLHSGLDSDDSFAVTIELEGRRISLTVSDPGVEFNPTSRSDDLNVQEAGRRLQRCGFGLSMVKGLCKTISYTRTVDHRNQLVITKYW
jgi:anti-sigma regulatory factor (Ser/Thr protein kinase)/anti-anti-sigma regulatory factor